MLTKLDQVANQHHLQIIKAALPYFPIKNQRTLSICIKMLEIQNILQFYHHSDAIITDPDSAPDGFVDILTGIRCFCDENEQAFLDQWIQLATTLELYSIFAQDSDAEEDDS